MPNRRRRIGKAITIKGPRRLGPILPLGPGSNARGWRRVIAPLGHLIPDSRLGHGISWAPITHLLGSGIGALMGATGGFGAAITLL